MTGSIVLLDGTTDVTRDQVGGKAYGIAKMRRLGLPVPPAFVLPTAACVSYFDGGGALSDAQRDGLRAGIAELERRTGRTFGAGPAPLLVSVRSGASVSMPGMMDTVLNLGVGAEVEAALAAESGDPRFAHDVLRRFLVQYARIVLGAEPPELASLAPDELQAAIEADCGQRVPADPYAQLEGAVEAVFRSWHSRRARAYRRHWGLGEDGGTAVTVQAMVFGNLGERSGTGVLFSRNPLTGAPAPYGEFLPGGQGEDVVSGSHDPCGVDELERTMPAAYAELLDAARTLEAEGRDVQDIEFTVERGRLYLLQTRPAKRSPHAAVRIAVQLVDDGVLTPAEALRHVRAAQVRTLLLPRVDPAARDAAVVLATGEPACPGVAQGVAVVDPDEAEQRAAGGEPIVLVRPTTSPDDIHGMIAAAGIATELGGSTSHAAVVGRSLGRPCVVGCGAGTLTPLAGRMVTVDGESGNVYDGTLPLRVASEDDDPDLRQLREWAERTAPLAVIGTGDVPADTVDLDRLGVVDADGVAAAARGHRGAVGRVLGTDGGVEAALAAGVQRIHVEHRLPALLAALHAPANTGAGRAGAVPTGAGPGASS